MPVPGPGQYFAAEIMNAKDGPCGYLYGQVSWQSGVIDGN
jgi:hypothetical protein